MARTCIETYGGTYFDLANPRAEDVNYLDIAHALSQLCRFNGHTSRFYSVAEHAVLVHDLVRANPDATPLLVLAALHHDSHEAYIGDVTTPLKWLLGRRYREHVEQVDDAVVRWLGLLGRAIFYHPIIRDADAMALRLEAMVFKPSQGLGDHWGNYQPPVEDGPRYSGPCRPTRPEPVGHEPERAEGIFQRCHTRALIDYSRWLDKS